jgi:glycosyltransferase involved in cell wall biosynthesis
MRVNKSFRILIYGDIGGSGGYIRYCKGLFGSGVTPKDMEILFVCSPELYNQIKPLDSNIKIFHHPWISSRFRLIRYLWHIILYPLMVRIYSPNVEFYPSGQVRLFLRTATTVSACHNLLLFDKSEMDRLGDQKTQNYYNIYRNNQIQSFKKACGVIFSSEYSKNIVLNQIPSINNYSVIPLGVESNFINNPIKNTSNLNLIKLLYVSPFWPYKHHEEVIQAVILLKEEINIDLQLTLVGGGSVQMLTKIKKIIDETNSNQFVEIKGNIKDSELIAEYSNADIFIFASTCEAFGITLVEAMRAHLPIACSNRTGLPDILKDAGEYFNPEDSNSIALALHKLIINFDYRSKLGEKAFEYSKDYTWEASALQTFTFLKEIANKNRGEVIN